MKTASKPRKFRSQGLPSARGECVVLDDGERVVDAAFDVFDGGQSSAEIKKFARWLSRAASWASKGSKP
jgi:hypothetical protein